MKRLVIITVGKTHSGKTTFARALEKEVSNAFVMDQDNHAEFINTYYHILQPKQGPNTLKHAFSKLIVEYAKKETNYNFIICNSNRSREGRLYLLEELFPKAEFVRILVHFDIPDNILHKRVIQSQRRTNIFRGAYSNYVDVLISQTHDANEEDIVDPIEGEADYLFVIKENEDIHSVIQEITQIEKLNIQGR